MKGNASKLSPPKIAKVPYPIPSNKGGVICTIAKLNNQLQIVETALALVLILKPGISAAYNQGSSSQVKPKKMRY